MLDIKLSPKDTDEQLLEKAVMVRPSSQQMAWQELEFTGFIHFGVNTFTDREWGDGTESPNIFNPTDFSAEQIVATAKEAGITAIILTCKHHDGFCLWPSKYTQHSVKNSVWKEGKGDVVREISNSCKKHGLKFGVYLSPWDRHDHRYGDSPAYNKYYLNQLTELLTEYGEIFDLWLDGACAEGPNGKKQEYDWHSIYALARKLQPNATITGVAPDARWCGNEAGVSRKSEWSVVPVVGTEKAAPELSSKTAKAFVAHNATLCQMEDLGSLEKLREHAKNGDRLYWYPAQVDVSIRPGWFYHKHEDDAVRPLEKLMDMYLYAVGGNAQFLLNLPPDCRGQIAQPDVKRLKDMGRIIKKTFSKNLIKEEEKINTQEFILKSGEDLANLFMLAEDISKGQRIESFELFQKENDKWQSLSKGTTVGYKKYIKLKRAVYSELKLVVTAARDIPFMKSFGLFLMPQLSKEVEITRDKDAHLCLEAENAKIYYTIDGSEPTENSKLYNSDDKLLLKNGGIVSALAVYENGDKAISKKELGIFAKNFNICNYSKEKIEEFNLNNVFSQDGSTYARLPCGENLPCIDFEMDKSYSIKGMHYMPIDTGYDANLNVSSFSLLISDNGKDFATVIENKELSNVYHNPILQKIYFEKAVKAKFIRFKVEASMSPENISIGKINLLISK